MLDKMFSVLYYYGGRVQRAERGGDGLRYRIAEARRFKKMSQEELSAKADVSRTIISALENGEETVTTTKTLEKIANALDLSVSDLFYDTRV